MDEHDTTTPAPEPESGRKVAGGLATSKRHGKKSLLIYAMPEEVAAIKAAAKSGIDGPPCAMNAFITHHAVQAAKRILKKASKPLDS